MYRGLAAAMHHDANLCGSAGDRYRRRPRNQYCRLPRQRRNRHARNNFSPRVGFSYDISGDNSLVVFGGYARAYDRNLFASLSLETTKVALNDNPEIYFPSPNGSDLAGTPVRQRRISTRTTAMHGIQLT